MNAPYTTQNDPIDIIPADQQTGKFEKTVTNIFGRYAAYLVIEHINALQIPY